jgi:hypothetical protein
MLFVTLQSVFCTGAMMLIIALVGDSPSQPPTDLSDHDT